MLGTDVSILQFRVLQMLWRVLVIAVVVVVAADAVQIVVVGRQHWRWRGRRATNRTIFEDPKFL